jgi:hypothetical protein
MKHKSYFITFKNVFNMKNSNFKKNPILAARIEKANALVAQLNAELAAIAAETDFDSYQNLQPMGKDGRYGQVKLMHTIVNVSIKLVDDDIFDLDEYNRVVEEAAFLHDFNAKLLDVVEISTKLQIIKGKQAYAMASFLGERLEQKASDSRPIYKAQLEDWESYKLEIAARQKTTVEQKQQLKQRDETIELLRKEKDQNIDKAGANADVNTVPKA